MIKSVGITFFTLALTVAAFAQTSPSPFIRPAGFVANEAIVRMTGPFNIENAKRALDASQYELKEVISPSLNMYLVQLKTRSFSEGFVGLRKNRAVFYAQPNHIVSLRGNVQRGPIESPFFAGRFNQSAGPNDPSFGKQWNMTDTSTGAVGGMGATAVWGTSTGGKDRAGQEIVVAIIDAGFDINHPDLKNNIWRFRGEIPNNGKDDDGNGFVDDVNGWNAYDNNGTIKVDDHGTHVAGIVGAQGNNGNGVVGVNWNIKIMPILGSSGTTAVIAKAYGYVIEQKKLWYQTKGQKGANIVVTNSSFGVDNANCKTGEFPAWNDLYEAMGQLGILSAVATANNNVDVDKVGDVPTGCESQFLVSVTNTQQNNTKFPQAGFGAKSIDLGSPGRDILSTVPGGRFREMTGTSMATPHVAGAVGLLYSVANENFLNKYYSSPAEAALIVKASLMQGVDPLDSLKGITVSGGRLNVAKSAQFLMNYQARQARRF
jgi:subtilisin family serine protease